MYGAKEYKQIQKQRSRAMTNENKMMQTESRCAVHQIDVDNGAVVLTMPFALSAADADHVCQSLDLIKIQIRRRISVAAIADDSDNK